jgi:hypothetical protein
LDTYLQSDAAASNFGTGVSLAVGIKGLTQTFRSLLKFDISSIPANAEIISATLYLTITGDNATATSTLYVVRSLLAWVEAQATYTNYKTGTAWPTAGGFGSGSSEVVDIGYKALSASESGTIAISLTPSKIKEMVSGAFTNNGFVLVAFTQNAEYDYASSDNATVGSRPKLMIEYRSAANIMWWY